MLAIKSWMLYQLGQPGTPTMDFFFEGNLLFLSKTLIKASLEFQFFTFTVSWVAVQRKTKAIFKFCRHSVRVEWKEDRWMDKGS